MKKQKTPFPRLPFGQSNNASNNCLKSFPAGSLSRIDLSASARQSVTSHSVSLGNLTAISISCIQLSATIGTSHPLLIIPFVGAGTSSCGDLSLRFDSTSSSVFLPKNEYHLSADNCSALVLRLDAEQLERTLSNFQKQPKDSSRSLSSCAPMALPLTIGTTDHQEMFWCLCQLIDKNLHQPVFLNNGGIDESLYRLSALLIGSQQGLFPPLATSMVKNDSFQRKAPDWLDLVVTYISENLDRKLVASDLEAIAGVSARAVQYAFKQHFDRTPTQWQIDKRLQAIRDLILSAEPHETVTKIASEYFQNFGDFARRYKQKFGELPSISLQKAQGSSSRLISPPTHEREEEANE